MPPSSWTGVILCYAGCVSSLVSIGAFFVMMRDWQSAATWGVWAVAIFDLVAIAAAISVICRGSRLQRLVAYPGVYLSFYFGLTHVVACWL